jgi:hypothetical protein
MPIVEREEPEPLCSAVWYPFFEKNELLRRHLMGLRFNQALDVYHYVFNMLRTRIWFP